MATYTTKQAAKKVRQDLSALAKGKRLIFDNGDRLGPFPAGLLFEVRATPKGNINVRIHDDRYVDHVTEGDRRSIDHREHLQPIVEQVIAYQERVWGKRLGKVEWGMVVIGVSEVTHAGTIRLGGDAA